MTPDEKEAILTGLQAKGWKIEQDPAITFDLPPDLKERYPKLPPEMIDLLDGLKSCVNVGQTAWLLCRDDFRSESELEWRWDEFEQMQLVWAEGEEDERRIRAFWDTHVPVLLSTHTGYVFFAVSLNPGSFGQVVHGLLENGNDEAEIVAGTIHELLTQVIDGRWPAEMGN